jgi:site-specific DNA-methyltransferase (adenine-specific)
MTEPHIERIGDAVLYLGDCYTILPTLPPVDAVVTDPPYGVALNTDGTRFSGGTAGHIGRKGNRVGSAGGRPILNDSAPFDPAFLTGYGEVQIVWGWNNYPDKLPRGTCLVWLKRHDDAFQSFLSDAELAWMSKGSGVYCRRDLSNNAIANHRVHPTQKPVSLMEWCLTSFLAKSETILDPFMGSGTTGVACANVGRKFVGIELDPHYFDVACERIAAAQSQGRLFA